MADNDLMTDPELIHLRGQAAAGDRDAADLLTELSDE